VKARCPERGGAQGRLSFPPSGGIHWRKEKTMSKHKHANRKAAALPWRRVGTGPDGEELWITPDNRVVRIFFLTVGG